MPHNVNSASTFLENIFITFFDWVYTYIHTNLVSYILVAVLTGGALYLNWKWIKTLHRRGNWLGTLIKFLLVAVQVFLIGFLAWFVFFYFHTFTMLDSGH